MCQTSVEPPLYPFHDAAVTRGKLLQHGDPAFNSGRISAVADLSTGMSGTSSAPHPMADTPAADSKEIALRW
jgi:hypothetical protein